MSKFKDLMDSAEKTEFTPLTEQVDYLFKIAEATVAYTDENSTMGADVPYIKYTATVEESADGENQGRGFYGVIFPYRLSQKTGDVRLQQDALKQVAKLIGGEPEITAEADDKEALVTEIASTILNAQFAAYVKNTVRKDRETKEPLVDDEGKPRLNSRLYKVRPPTEFNINIID